jgi:hypothetical protein
MVCSCLREEARSSSEASTESLGKVHPCTLQHWTEARGTNHTKGIIVGYHFYGIWIANDQSRTPSSYSPCHFRIYSEGVQCWPERAEIQLFGPSES